MIPLWAGEQAKVRDTLYLAYENKMRAVRDERYKLIRYPLIDHVQLFDLEQDPDEMHDLAGDPEHAARVERMEAWMREWKEQLLDPHPLEVEDPQPMAVDLSGRTRKPDRWQPEWIRAKYFADD